MALKQQGTAHVYGVSGTITDATVQSHNIKDGYRNLSETLNESGNKVEDRRDDYFLSGDITIRYTASYTKPKAGDTLAFDGETFLITDTSDAKANNAHAQLTLTVETFEHITLS